MSKKNKALAKSMSEAFGIAYAAFTKNIMTSRRLSPAELAQLEAEADADGPEIDLASKAFKKAAKTALASYMKPRRSIIRKRKKKS